MQGSMAETHVMRLQERLCPVLDMASAAARCRSRVSLRAVRPRLAALRVPRRRHTPVSTSATLISRSPSRRSTAKLLMAKGYSMSGLWL